MFLGMFLRSLRHPLHRAGLQAALRRSAAYWLVPCVVPGPVAVPYVNDTWLFCDRLSEEACALRLLVLKDFEAMSFVAHFLRPTDHLVDVGAGVGSYSVLAAVASGARVSAFEPAEQAAALLSCNVILNQLQARVRVAQLGLAELAGQRVFGPGSESGRRLVVDPCADSRACVPVSRLDDVLGKDGAQLLKIDAAGDELAVLRGAYASLANRGLYAVIVATPAGAGVPSNWHKIDALLERHGFVAAGYDPFARRLLKPGAVAGKGLYVRRWQAETIMRRLERASGFRPTPELFL